MDKWRRTTLIILVLGDRVGGQSCASQPSLPYLFWESLLGDTLNKRSLTIYGFPSPISILGGA